MPRVNRLLNTIGQNITLGADEMRIVKTCTRDGTAILSYEIRNLQTAGHTLKRVYFDVESVAGVVDEPQVDAASQALRIVWRSGPSRPPRTIGGVVDRIRKVSGHFVGNFYSTPEDPPSRKGQTFGWTLPVLNCDAVSSWEYNNLYPKKSQKHVDGSPLPLHLEYFAALVWIPVKQLTMQLNLPASISEARRCQHFQLKQRKNRSVPKDEVLAKKILYLRPNPKSRWGGLNARWEPAPGPLGQHSYTFEYQPDGSAKVSVDSPPIGSYFSIDWQVPDPRVNERFDHLIREAEFAREPTRQLAQCTEDGARERSLH